MTARMEQERVSSMYYTEYGKPFTHLPIWPSRAPYSLGGRGAGFLYAWSVPGRSQPNR
jgi:hypothetical protein